MVWQQVYDPLSNMWLSTLLAAIPVVVMLVGLGFLHMKAHLAAGAGLIAALVIAVFVYNMPAGMAGRAALFGGFTGLLPIGWIVLNIIFLHQLTEKNGSFKILQDSIAGITEDRRIQLLLIAFAFGAFFEGAAGFGTPVAVTAAILIGLGFSPLAASGLSLIANTAPVAFGALGTPVITLAKVHGYDLMEVTAMVGRQLPFFSVLVPFWLIWAFAGRKAMMEIWPIILVTGVSFAIPQYLVSNFIGPELPDITSAIVSLVALTLFLKVWQPKRIFRFDTEGEGGKAAAVAAPAITSGAPLTAGAIIKAWSPFIILTAMVTVWSIKPFKALFAAGGPLASTVINIPVPFLHNLVEKTPPVVAAAAPYGAVYTFNWLLATGTAILIAALITITFTRLSPAKAVATLGETFRELAVPIYSIGMVLAFAFVANYSGLSATLALALAHTGQAFTFFSPFLGWIGVFLTGSDTSANALFAALQATTAQQLGLPQVLTVAANTTGGVTGKMISPQSIAIACAAVGLAGRESDLFRFTVKHSLMFAVIIGVITTLQAYVFTWMIPGY